MGRLLNTTYQETVDNITGFYDNLVNNPFYIFNDKKPITCIYYNINKTYSSLDPGSHIQYDNRGKDSPIRYNRIYDFLLYGFPKIEINSENGDFGLEDEKIEVDCYVLPNAFGVNNGDGLSTVTEGDFFVVNHIKQSTFLFQVTDAQQDTLQNGSNVFRIHAKIEHLNMDEIETQVVHNYRMIFTGENNQVSIIRCEDYNIAKKMDKYAVMLKGYYSDIFYREGVQTYIYEDLTSVNIYDPYLIEFLMRNDILSHAEEYIHVCHQIPTQKTFAIDYDRTIFRFFEKKDKHLLRSLYIVGAKEINAYGTIFYSRFEEYYSAAYFKTLKKYYSYCIDDDLVHAVENHELVEDIRDPNGNSPIWKNIIIKYFYDESITEEELDSIMEMDFEYSKDAFYLIPIMIFCLEKAIEKVISPT